MRKKVAMVLSILLIIVLSACNTQKSAATKASNNSGEIYREHQKLTAFQTSFDANNMMRITIPEVGLENVYIREVSANELLDENTYGQVYLLADDRYGGNCGTSDHYLAIVNGDALIIEELSSQMDFACYTGNFELCDIDGDKDKEVILQECIGMAGGAGQYLSRVFDFDNGKIIEIFSSNDGKEKFNTGFSVTFLKNNRFIIENNFTEYNEVFHLENRSEEYYRNNWYSENGEPKSLSILVDSFYEFIPDDIDGDGVCEIVCRQYVSLIGHSDGSGDAKTVLKYNKDTTAFEVISSEFELYK